MMGLLVLLLFGFTGFTLNHEDWFGSATPREEQVTGKIPVALATSGDTHRIVETIRQNFKIHGAVTSFGDLNNSFTVSYRAPGQSWDAEIDKTTGAVAIHVESYNFFAVLNNLHRGQFTGFGWRVIIDICAIVIVLACVTGVVLWLALPKRRMLGTAVLAIGTVATLIIYIYLVPGADEPIAANDTSPPAAATPPAP